MEVILLKIVVRIGGMGEEIALEIMNDLFYSRYPFYRKEGRTQPLFSLSERYIGIRTNYFQILSYRDEEFSNIADLRINSDPGGMWIYFSPKKDNPSSTISTIKMLARLMGIFLSNHYPQKLKGIEVIDLV